MDSDYVCTLNEACLRQAKEELNEDPKDRLSAVRQLRDWIQNQPHLTCRMDTMVLLKVLRTAKFSQLRAREIVEDWLRVRTILKPWYSNLNPKEKYTTDLLKAGFICPLPGYYDNGAKVRIIRPAVIKKVFPKLDRITQQQKDAIVRAVIIINQFQNRDENCQVDGVVAWLDCTDCPLSVFTIFSIQETRKMMQFQGKVPGRIKGAWIFNEPPFIDVLLGLFKPFMKPKLKNRMKFFGSNLENVYKDVPMRMLPDEWLPDDYTGPSAGTFHSIAERFWNELCEEDYIQELLYETSDKWKIDDSKKPQNTPTQSFRKLTLD